ncbi:MAG: hypothetical protein R3284_11535 [Rubricoccaceae bacterium]|nr:hypothetical protein [Rubricoccaceae bacterium]
MKIRFINPTLHGLLDYAAAAALIVTPFILDLGAQGQVAQWLSILGGIGLVLYSLVTDYAFGVTKILSYKIHLMLDLAAAVAFLAAPFVFRFTGLVAGYYFVMALGVVLVVALSNQTTEDVSTPITSTS